jgi:putative inorganic carbon (HCO3(-)) transporter
MRLESPAVAPPDSRRVNHPPGTTREARTDASRWTYLGLLIAGAVCVTLVAVGEPVGVTLFIALAAGAVAIVAAYALWRAPPAYTLSAGLFCSVFAGNWTAMGLPAKLPPDRILETLGIIAVALRLPGVAERRLRPDRVHVLMVVMVMYVAMNAIIAAGAVRIPASFILLDGVGVYPFLLFLVAPVAFANAEDRNVLLVALVCLGAYLGLTALMETLHLNSLVFPKYILNPLYGDPSTAGRARGPFAAAVQNGFGLYACVVGAALAVALWRSWYARATAAAVGFLCLLGTLFTEQRSVWIATAAATLLAFVIVPKLRRWVLPALTLATLAVIAAISVIPGLSADLHTRVVDNIPVWERLNLNVAAEHMVLAKPIFGFGWGTFAAASSPYFKQSDSYPLVYTTVVHNVYLSFAAELGLVGLLLWLLVLAAGVGGAVRSAVFALRPWRAGLLAYAAFYFIVIAFVPPPTSFPPQFLWLLAGLVRGQHSRTVAGPRSGGRLLSPGTKAATTAGAAR